ncbi:MAG: hypothetical protein Q7S86_02680 [bacterium]|nr:hypothetical protein [bacterium]
MTAYRVSNPSNPEGSPLIHLIIPVQGIINMEEGVEMVLTKSGPKITSISFFQVKTDIETTLNSYRAQHCVVEEFSMDSPDADDIVRAATLHEEILEKILPELKLPKSYALQSA